MDRSLTLRRNALSLLLLVLLLATACQADRRVADGRFVKRKYTGGWHIDLHGRRERDRRMPAQAADHPTGRAHVRAPSAPVADMRTEAALPSVQEAPLASVGPEPLVPRDAGARTFGPGREPERPVVRSTATKPDGTVVAQDDVAAKERRKQDPMAVASFVTVWLGLGLGITTGLPGLLAALWLFALILAVGALLRIPKNGNGGRGWAIATLALVTLLGIAALVASNNMSINVRVI